MNELRQGFLLLHKPTGMTSHTAVRRAARALGAPKAGHAGTLDPLASGLLLVGLGRAARLLEYLVGCDKTYRALLRLGQETDTLDREGAVTATRPVPPIAPEALAAALARFRGPIAQIPPIHSAIKVGGVALHRRARRGEEVAPPPREVTISRLEALAFDPPDLALEIDCSSGTYIRSLARDLGDALGTGATLWELARTRCGPYLLADAVALAEIEERREAAWDRALPPARMVEGLPAVRLNAEDSRAVRHGIPFAHACDGEGDCALYSDQGEFLAIGTRSGDRMLPRKVFG